MFWADACIFCFKQTFYECSVYSRCLSAFSSSPATKYSDGFIADGSFVKFVTCCGVISSLKETFLKRLCGWYSFLPYLFFFDKLRTFYIEIY